MNASQLTSTSVPIDHIVIKSPLPFAEVRRKLEASLPRLDAGIVDRLASGDKAGAASYDRDGPTLSIFLERDHGALLALYGRPRNAIQYEIGNPLTASKMTRHRLAAALYAPLRVALYESQGGETILEYDKPSSLFGQFGDGDVLEVGRNLDKALETALLAAAF